MTLHTFPLKLIPTVCFPQVQGPSETLRSLRLRASPEQGFFMTRRRSASPPYGSFLLGGVREYEGRWLLGRVRQNILVPGHYEILVRTGRYCYYQNLSDTKKLAQELRILGEDGDDSLTIPGSPWYLKWDPEFEEHGFV